MKNFMNFDKSTLKSKRFALWLAPLTKVYNVYAKIAQRSLCLMTLKIDAKFQGKLVCAFKNDKEFVKFASAEINEEHN